MTAEQDYARASMRGTDPERNRVEIVELPLPVCLVYNNKVANGPVFGRRIVRWCIAGWYALVDCQREEGDTDARNRSVMDGDDGLVTGRCGSGDGGGVQSGRADAE